jgi:hypothetical protein
MKTFLLTVASYALVGKATDHLDALTQGYTCLGKVVPPGETARVVLSLDSEPEMRLYPWEPTP